MTQLIKIITIALILSLFFLNGCIKQDKEINIDFENNDADNDGFFDYEDDFPNDSNLHKKQMIISGSETLEKNEGIGGFLDIDSNCKFVLVNWTIIAPKELSSDVQQKISFEVNYPPSNNEFNNISKDYPYSIENNRNLRFEVTSSNLGKWSYGFLNGSESSNVTISREIFFLL